MDKQKGSPRFTRVEAGLAPILIVLLIALAVGGYLIYQKQFKPVPISQPSPSPVITPVASNSAETENWKTYINRKLGYSFKYPSNWLDKTTQQDQQQGFINLEIGINDSRYYFMVGLTPTLSGISTAYDIESYEFENEGIIYSGIKGLKEGVPVLISVQPKNPYSVNGRIQIFFPSTQSKTYTEIFNQILSTFKFTK